LLFCGNQILTSLHIKTQFTLFTVLESLDFTADLPGILHDHLMSEYCWFVTVCCSTVHQMNLKGICHGSWHPLHHRRKATGALCWIFRFP